MLSVNVNYFVHVKVFERNKMLQMYYLCHMISNISEMVYFHWNKPLFPLSLVLQMKKWHVQKY